MNTTNLSRTHPLVLGAAASVMMVSLICAAVNAGMLPNARSDNGAYPAKAGAPAADGAVHVRPQLSAYSSECTACGTVESIHRVELKGDASGLGAVAGGLTGAVVGSQIGRSHANTAMALVGAAGGALAGNEIEKNVKIRYAYRVTVRMDDGSFRTFSQPGPPAVAVGDHVRAVNGSVVARL